MRHDWLKARQTKYTAYAAVYTLVIVAVLAAINFLANRYPKTYDSTANKQFSLADQTVTIGCLLGEPAPAVPDGWEASVFPRNDTVGWLVLGRP